MSLSPPVSPRRRGALLALVLLVGMAATVGTALLFQHVGGFVPCALCLEQRTPYYLAVPVAALALALALLPRPPAVPFRLALVAIGLLMLWGLGLAVHHSGVEWGVWAGPADCSGAAGGLSVTDDLLGSLDGVRPPSCDTAAGRFLGLSFAGWNVLASALFAALALLGAWRYSGSSSESQ